MHYSKKSSGKKGTGNVKLGKGSRADDLTPQKSSGSKFSETINLLLMPLKEGSRNSSKGSSSGTVQKRSFNKRQFTSPNAQDNPKGGKRQVQFEITFLN